MYCVLGKVSVWYRFPMARDWGTWRTVVSVSSDLVSLCIPPVFMCTPSI